MSQLAIDGQHAAHRITTHALTDWNNAQVGIASEWIHLDIDVQFATTCALTGYLKALLERCAEADDCTPLELWQHITLNVAAEAEGA